jgi:DNA polymerase
MGFCRFGAPLVKDKEGRALTLGLSRPDRKGLYPEITPETVERVTAYNKVDVDGLAAVHAAVGVLPERERQVWELDQRINARGFRVDLDFVRGAKQIAEAAKAPLFEEFAELTGGLSPTQVERILDWLKGRGFASVFVKDLKPSLDSAIVKDALENLVLPDDVRRVLEIRQITGPASLAKLDAMAACAGTDGRARGQFLYHGAHTGRWAGALIQPQNLPRPTVDIAPGEIEDVVAAVKTGEPAALDRFGKPIDVLVSALRYALTAAEGMQLGSGDFSEIEARVALALAGQHDKCQLLANGVDVYRDMAARIYGLDRDAFLAIPKNELTVEQQQQRQAGKNTILGCGFGLGADTFRSKYCRHMGLGSEDAQRFAKEAIQTYRNIWAPKVRDLWSNLGHAARRAMLNSGATVEAQCGITYRLDTKAGLPCLVCRLLNGKSIYYMNAIFLSGEDAYDLYGNRRWTYWRYFNGGWSAPIKPPWGGTLTENVASALARELLTDAMLRFEARGFPIVMHVHDEIIVEHPRITEAIIEEIMAEPPRWAAKLGVPIAVEKWVGRRYRK